MNEEEHKAYHRRLLYVAILMLILFFGSATFYHRVEKWRYIDAMYFSAATMTTVGYGDITPKTDGGKLFTIFFVFMGVGIALYGLTLMATHFVEIREEFWLQRLGKIRIRHHTHTLWDKLKGAFSYNPRKLAHESEEAVVIPPKKRKRRG